MRTLPFVAVLVAALFASPLPASAAPPAPGDNAAAAKEHYKRGTTLYDLNRFEEAVKEFEAAYELKDDPVLLYNIAQSYRLANKYPEALRFYRNYLRRSPKAPNRAEVEQKIEDMEKLISEQNRVATAAPDSTIAPGQKPQTATPPPPPPQPARPVQPAQPPPPPPPQATRPVTPPPVAATEPGEPVDKPVATTPPPTRPATKPVATTPPPTKPVAKAPTKAADEGPAKPGKTKLIAGIAIAVVGLAAVGAGVAFGMMAQGAAADQAAAKTFDPDLESKGKSYQTIGLALDAAGGVIALAGVGVAVWGAMQKPEKARSSSYQVVPAVGRGFAGAALNLRF